MIAWKRQGSAIIGDINTLDNRRGTVVLVGAPKNPKGAVLILPNPDGSQGQPALLASMVSLLHPRLLIDILCMQERGFGASGLPKPDGLA
ncbi:MAG TPA: hypothetical protein PLI09_07715 [Candidatus Hydrogenedentes bacterium]|nr:hypothetical protein [Candidatus Hydrogenedentota bacterium]